MISHAVVSLLPGNQTKSGSGSSPRASGNKMRGRVTPRTLLSLTVRLLDGTQLLEQLLVGESGHHEELILGKEVINELLLHFSCLARTKKTGVRRVKLL